MAKPTNPLDGISTCADALDGDTAAQIRWMPYQGLFQLPHGLTKTTLAHERARALQIQGMDSRTANERVRIEQILSIQYGLERGTPAETRALVFDALHAKEAELVKVASRMSTMLFDARRDAVVDLIRDGLASQGGTAESLRGLIESWDEVLKLPTLPGMHPEVPMAEDRIAEFDLLKEQGLTELLQRAADPSAPKSELGLSSALLFAMRTTNEQIEELANERMLLWQEQQLYVAIAAEASDVGGLEVLVKKDIRERVSDAVKPIDWVAYAKFRELTIEPAREQEVSL